MRDSIRTFSSGYDLLVTNERLTFTCTRDSATGARRLIKSFGATRLAEPNISDLAVAVGEALVNSLEYGLATEIDVCCSYDSTSLVVELCDNGQGVDHPKSVDSEALSRTPARTLGYGFRIMRELADEVTYSKGGRQVILKKRYNSSS
jgi:anti-sigma regulatory factor (Ser/Thr protein kinase)